MQDFGSGNCCLPNLSPSTRKTMAMKITNALKKKMKQAMKKTPAERARAYEFGLLVQLASGLAIHYECIGSEGENASLIEWDFRRGKLGWQYPESKKAKGYTFVHNGNVVDKKKSFGDQNVKNGDTLTMILEYGSDSEDAYTSPSGY